MPDSLSNSPEVKLLPGTGGTLAVVPEPSPAAPGVSPERQLSELPRDELEHLAEEFGLEPHDYLDLPQLVSAIHDRRQMIASLNRDAMLDVVRWARRPVTANATREQIAQEIARSRSMRFAGLSQRGLVVLAHARRQSP